MARAGNPLTKKTNLCSEKADFISAFSYEEGDFFEGQFRDKWFSQWFYRNVSRRTSQISSGSGIFVMVASDFSAHEKSQQYLQQYIRDFFVHGISFQEAALVDFTISQKEAVSLV